MRDPVSRGLALAALVVAALGFTGVGEAVRNAILPPGSVGTAQLRDNAVTSEKIRSGAVTSADIKNGTVAAGDLAAGTIPAGTAFVVRRLTKDITALGEYQLVIPCDDGQVPVGGGGGFLSTTTTDYVGNEFYGSLINSAPSNRHEGRRRPCTGNRLDHHGAELRRKEASRRLRDLRVHPFSTCSEAVHTNTTDVVDT